jgi:hypothetical protein
MTHSTPVRRRQLETPSAVRASRVLQLLKFLEREATLLEDLEKKRRADFTPAMKRNGDGASV